MTTFISYALKGGKNGAAFYVIHAVVLAMGGYMVAVPEDAHWAAITLLAAVLVVLWVGTYVQWLKDRISVLTQDVITLTAPWGWHGIHADITDGPVKHGHNKELDLDWVQSPWMDTPLWVRQGLGVQIASIANRAWKQGSSR